MDDRIITSLDKGLQLLTALSSADAPQPLASLARRFPWDKSTVYRTLETLRLRGFVEQSAAGYTLGPAAAALGRPAAAPSLLDRARELMQEAAALTQENAHLAVNTGDEMVFIDQRSGGRFNLHTEIGGREPLHCTAIGKAYLMTLEAAERKTALARLRYDGFTRRTITGAAALTADLKLASRRGFAVDDREYSDDVRCAAVPLCDAAGRFVVALGVSGPASRVTGDRLPELGALLSGLAATLFTEKVPA